MRASLLLVLWICVPAHAYCSLGKNLLETAEVCRLRRGNYIGVKQKDFSVPPSDTDLCFYAPDLVDKCLPSEDFLSCGCDDEQMCYTHKCQHKREDVIYDDDHRQLRIFNFRMMPPDDERDAAFVIRLYNNTVVWLMMNGSCSTTSLVLSNIWKPTRYILDEDYPTIANSFTLTTSAEVRITVTSVVTPTATSQPCTVPTPAESIALGAGGIVGIAVSSVVILVIAFVGILVLVLIYLKKKNKETKVAAT